MPRPKLKNRLLALSLVLNLLALVGGFFWVKQQGGWLALVDATATRKIDFHRDPYQTLMESRHRKLPNTQNEIVFLGDSITKQGPWSEVFSNIRNRGIGGNSTRSVLARLDEITESKPLKIFLHAGTNDLPQGIGLEQTTANYRRILQQIRQASPKTQVYIISVLPVNSTIQNILNYKNNHINRINEQLAKLAEEFAMTYVDLHSQFTDSRGRLRSDLTVDGLHLNTEGYLHYCSLIADLVRE